MHILFTEIKPEEQKIFKNTFKDYQVSFTSKSINSINLADYKNITILCVFIHSKITPEIIAQLPQLKLIVTRSTGIDHIDAEAAQERGIIVYNAPTYASQAVAEYTFALILSLARKLKIICCQPQNQYTISQQGPIGFELKGKTIGIIGLGAIGKIVGHIAQGFGMHIIACDKKEDNFYAQEVDCTFTSFQELLAKADIITFHIPLTPQTYHMLNFETINHTKQGAIIINTARGGIIDTAALLEALNTGHIAGAALDVFENEEHITPETHQLIEHPYVIISPHNAFNTREACTRLVQETIYIIKNWIEEVLA